MGYENELLVVCLFEEEESDERVDEEFEAGAFEVLVSEFLRGAMLLYAVLTELEALGLG